MKFHLRWICIKPETRSLIRRLRRQLPLEGKPFGCRMRKLKGNVSKYVQTPYFEYLHETIKDFGTENQPRHNEEADFFLQGAGFLSRMDAF